MRVKLFKLLALKCRQNICDLHIEGAGKKLEHRRDTQLAMLMYKIFNNLSPLYLRKIFSNTSSVHSYNLRNSAINLHIPRYKSERGICSLHYRNKITVEVRNQTNLKAFKLRMSNIKNIL